MQKSKHNIEALKKFKMFDNVELYDTQKDDYEYGYISGMIVNCHGDICFQITIPRYDTNTYNQFSIIRELNHNATLTVMKKIA